MKASVVCYGCSSRNTKLLMPCATKETEDRENRLSQVEALKAENAAMPARAGSVEAMARAVPGQVATTKSFS